MFCANCGLEINNNNNFCRQCGMTVKNIHPKVDNLPPSTSDKPASVDLLIKRHKIFFIIFLILSIVGIIEVGTTQIVSAQYGLDEIGIIGFSLGNFFSIIFGGVIGSALMTWITIILNFALLWIIIATVEYFKIKKLKKKII